MSMTFARLLDPTFQDDHDPFRFFVEYSVALQNRMYNLRYQLPPDFDSHFSQPGLPTTLALMREELVYPEHLKTYPLDALTQLIHQASHGKLGAELAQALVRSAHTTFSVPTAAETLSFNLKMLAQAYEQIHQLLLPPSASALKRDSANCPLNTTWTRSPISARSSSGPSSASWGDQPRSARQTVSSPGLASIPVSLSRLTNLRAPPT